MCANRLVIFAIIAIIERQWSYLMKWKQEETRRATEHGHTHTPKGERRPRLKTQERMIETKREKLFLTAWQQGRMTSKSRGKLLQENNKNKINCTKKSYHECGLVWINEPLIPHWKNKAEDLGRRGGGIKATPSIHPYCQSSKHTLLFSFMLNLAGK